MPITHSAKKALRQSKRRRARNIKKITDVKRVLKQVRELAARQKTDEAKKLLPLVYKTLDKAAKTGVIKKNTASRKKSRLARQLAAKPATS
ncbi:MAG: 30S ribosomal protein S20 [Candidatus Wildermuthbacteria bacterium]|nr:30S ribosomal protein S20 [Candidatus Wildermuthbacteria bacterium]